MLIPLDPRPAGYELRDAAQPQRFYVRLAKTWSEVEAAQRLRWRVFSDEPGARLRTGRPGLDWDQFDDHSDHLLAFDSAQGRVVGTYRILPPQNISRLGGSYSDTEFDLSALSHLRQKAAEIGRACIDPAWRGSTVLALMWTGLIQYARERELAHLLGCASVPIDDGGTYAANLYESLRGQLAPASLQAVPIRGLDIERLKTGEPVQAPPLIRGYLRAGAKICGRPAVDPQFNTADFLMLLDINALSRRYARRFDDTLAGLGRQALAA
jgi:putative hemolysin